MHRASIRLQLWFIFAILVQFAQQFLAERTFTTISFPGILDNVTGRIFSSVIDLCRHAPRLVILVVLILASFVVQFPLMRRLRSLFVTPRQRSTLTINFGSFDWLT